MRPSFRLGSTIAAPHPPSDASDGRADVVCELSPMQPLRRPPHSPPVEDRLLHYGSLYHEKLREAQAAKQRQDEEAAKEFTRPSSALQPRRLFAPTPSLHASAEAARRHRLDRQAAYMAEKTQQAPRQPAILPASRDMAEALRQREKWDGLSVGEILLARQRVHDERMEERRRTEAAKLSFKPAVSAHTRQLKVTGTVVDRLYAGRHAPAKSSAALADVTNRHRPASKEKNSSPCAATYHRLYDDAVTRRTQSETQKQLRQVRTSGAFQPRINPVSDLIASQSGDTAHTRLLRPRSELDPACHAHPEETFKPRINTVTPQPTHASLATRNERWLQRRRDRLRQVAEEREERETRECTFRPRTNRGPSSSSPWGLEDDVAASTLPSSSDDLIDSAEELLSRLDLDDDALGDAFDRRDTSRHWADVLRSTVPDDVFGLLEDAEFTSWDARRPSHTYT